MVVMALSSLPLPKEREVWERGLRRRRRVGDVTEP